MQQDQKRIRSNWGLSGVGALQPGDHLCAIFENDGEHRAIVTHFVRQGIGRNESVVYVADDRSIDTVRGYLADDGLDVERLQKSGQLSIITSRDGCAPDGRLDSDSMIALFRRETERATNDGYAALRITAEMTESLRDPAGDACLIEYEARLNEYFRDAPCLAMCQYDRRKTSLSILLDVLKSHPIVIIGSELYENHYYVPPEKLLGEDAQASKLNRWIRSLQRRKETEEALRSSEERFDLAVRGADEGLWDWWFASDDSWVSPRFKEMIGFEEDSDWGSAVEFWQSRLHPDDSERVEQAIRDHTERRVPYDIEYRLQTRDGEWRWFVARGQAQWNADGQAIRMAGSIRDITERKCVEEALRESEENFRRLAESSPVSIAILSDADEVKFVYVNPAWEEIFGYTREEAKMMNVADVLHPDMRDSVLERGRARLRGEQVPSRYELKIVAKGEVTKWLDFSATIIRYHGKATILTVANDITNRKHAEEQLKASLREKGVLLKEVHHRVKNNMQIMSSLLRLQARTVKDPVVAEVLADSQSRVHAMAQVHTQLYESRDLTNIAFEEYLRSLAQSSIRAHGDGRIHVAVRTEGEDFPIDIGLAVPCGLVINELLTNALKHAFAPNQQGNVEILLKRTGASYVELVVRDDGVGFPEGADPGNADSLGLKLVWMLVQDQLKGEIDVRRSAGTEFRIRFPITVPTANE